MTTYEEAKANGNLTLLNNKDLSKEFIKFETNYSFYSEIQSQAMDSYFKGPIWELKKSIGSSIVNTIKEQHDFHIKIIKKLHKVGVTFICGTDAGISITIPGFSIHQELSFYKEAGLSNYEVLKTATVNASKTHAIMNNMGTVEVGKIANLILIDQNPLLDLSALKKPRSVFVNGRKLSRETLDNFENKAKDRNNLIASALRYAENWIIEK